MTVKELRELLKSAPDDAEVWAGFEADHPFESDGAYGHYSQALMIGYGNFEKEKRLLIGGVSGNLNPVGLATLYHIHLLAKDNPHQSDA